MPPAILQRKRQSGRNPEKCRIPPAFCIVQCIPARKEEGYMMMLFGYKVIFDHIHVHRTVRREGNSVCCEVGIYGCG